MWDAIDSNNIYYSNNSSNSPTNVVNALHEELKEQELKNEMENIKKEMEAIREELASMKKEKKFLKKDKKNLLKD
jgi:predicted nuclease with TOPRIM domain